MYQLTVRTEQIAESVTEMAIDESMCAEGRERLVRMLMWSMLGRMFEPTDRRDVMMRLSAELEGTMVARRGAMN
jgi:hypothetical protein